MLVHFIKLLVVGDGLCMCACAAKTTPTRCISQDDAVEGGGNMTLHSTLALPESGPTGSNEATSNGRETLKLGSGLALKSRRR